MAFIVIWAISTYFGRSAAGVTGSDPYAYTQMAVDLVRRSTLLHQFPLAQIAYQLNVAVWPTVHVGYHIPPGGQTESASVWPPGTSILLAIGYTLAGERGLLWTPSLFGLLAVMMAGVLVYELFSDYPLIKRLWLSAITVTLLATSYRQVELTLVPMSDVPAQFFATLTVWASVRAARKASWQWGIVTGIALGISCFIRYTHLLMLAPILVTTYWFRQQSNWRLTVGRWLIPAGLAFIVVDLPLLWYHQIAFGSPFITASSKELGYFSLTNILPVAHTLVKELFRTNEFFYLLPFLVGGIWIIWQTERHVFVLLTTWFMGLTVFHLPYAALHLRGIFSIMPVLAGLVAFGIVVWIQYWKKICGPRVNLICVFMIAIPLVAFLLRSRLTLLLPLGSEFNTFGYLNAAERNAFGEMAQIVPTTGVIGCSLNSGAVDLYANRLTFRPAYWNEQEFNQFLLAMHTASRPVYLLVDGDEMQMPLTWAQQRARLVPLWETRLPFFSPNGSSSPRIVTLWQLNMTASYVSPHLR